MEIRLEPFQRTDIPRLMSWVRSEEFLIQWAGPFFMHPLDEVQLVKYWESWQGESAIRRIYRVSISDPEPKVIGHIELNNIDWRNRAGSVSKVLIGERQYLGKGYGVQMVDALLKIAFDELHLHRMELKVFDFNEPAIHAYQRVGFVIEGHLRDYRRVGEQYWSSYLMSILEDEWRERQNE